MLRLGFFSDRSKFNEAFDSIAHHQTPPKQLPLPKRSIHLPCTEALILKRDDPITTSNNRNRTLEVQRQPTNRNAGI